MMLKIMIWSGAKEFFDVKTPIKKSFKRYLVAGVLLLTSFPIMVMTGKKIYFYWSEQMHTFFTPEEARIILLTAENNILEEKITTFVQQHIIKKSLLTNSPEILSTLLQKNFPAIKKITYEYQPPKTILFHLEGTKPTCLVNENLVIGDQAVVLDQSNFCPEALAGLPKIVINQQWLANKIVLPSLYTLLHRLSPEQWARFRFTYHAPWLIEAVPLKSIVKTAILATEHSLFEPKKFDAISTIFQDLCSRGIITKKVLEAKNRPFLFDTRIKDQVIVRCNQPTKKGRGHG
jgi:hypothetical protein